MVQAFEELDFLLACNSSTHIFTEHRNLLFTLNPVATEPFLGRHRVLKVVCWALFLSALTHRIEQVPGDANTWFDIMTRWMRRYRRALTIRRIAIALPISGTVQSPDMADSNRPSESQIHGVQSNGTRSAYANKDMNSFLQLITAFGFPTMSKICNLDY